MSRKQHQSLLYHITCCDHPHISRHLREFVQARLMQFGWTLHEDTTPEPLQPFIQALKWHVRKRFILALKEASVGRSFIQALKDESVGIRLHPLDLEWLFYRFDRPGSGYSTNRAEQQFKYFIKMRDDSYNPLTKQIVVDLRDSIYYPSQPFAGDSPARLFLIQYITLTKLGTGSLHIFSRICHFAFGVNFSSHLPQRADLASPDFVNVCMSAVLKFDPPRIDIAPAEEERAATGKCIIL